jgi:hypothetical protein
MSGKGVRPEDVYIRQGASSMPASESTIRIIREMVDRGLLVKEGSGRKLTYWIVE